LVENSHTHHTDVLTTHHSLRACRGYQCIYTVSVHIPTLECCQCYLWYTYIRNKPFIIYTWIYRRVSSRTTRPSSLPSSLTMTKAQRIHTHTHTHTYEHINLSIQCKGRKGLIYTCIRNLLIFSENSFCEYCTLRKT
jgi:hypothetical protein